jgi:hypothetical protein
MSEKALSRDDVIRLLFEKDFFASNPALADIAETVNECKIGYVKDSYARCCGGWPGLMFPALDALFGKLRELKETDPAAVQNFCSFVQQRGNYSESQFLIYYRKGKEGRPERLAIP